MNCPQSAAQKIQEQDAAVYRWLAHCSVLTHCWGIVNGHEDFYNRCPPTREALQASRDLLTNDRNATGQQYLELIVRLLEQ